MLKRLILCILIFALLLPFVGVGAEPSAEIIKKIDQQVLEKIEAVTNTDVTLALKHAVKIRYSYYTMSDL